MQNILRSMVKHKEAARGLPEVFLLWFCSVIASVIPLIHLQMTQSWVGKQAWGSKLSWQNRERAWKTRTTARECSKRWVPDCMGTVYLTSSRVALFREGSAGLQWIMSRTQQQCCTVMKKTYIVPWYVNTCGVHKTPNVSVRQKYLVQFWALWFNEDGRELGSVKGQHECIHTVNSSTL